MKTNRIKKNRAEKKKHTVLLAFVCTAALLGLVAVGILLYRKKNAKEMWEEDPGQDEEKTAGAGREQKEAGDGTLRQAGARERGIQPLKVTERALEGVVANREERHFADETGGAASVLDEEADEGEEEHPMRKKLGKWIKRFLKLLIFLGIICLPLLFMGIVRVNGSSMQPTLNGGDYVIYLQTSGPAEVGDVILFERNGEKYIKRVYALSGDTVRMDENGTLLVNGKPQLIEGLIVMGANDPRDMKEEITVGENEYFVLGDHRSVSLDSRDSEIGMIKQEEIFGKYLFSIRK